MKRREQDDLGAVLEDLAEDAREEARAERAAAEVGVARRASAIQAMTDWLDSPEDRGTPEGLVDHLIDILQGRFGYVVAEAEARQFHEGAGPAALDAAAYVLEQAGHTRLAGESSCPGCRALAILRLPRAEEDLVAALEAWVAKMKTRAAQRPR